jgi:putative tricarboxylic transport membrane protein
MKRKGLLLCSILAAIVSMCAFVDRGYAADPAFKLKNDVQFICPFSPGGGSDIYARIAADIIQKSGWVDQPVMVVNKPGGGGAVGDAYTFSRKGNPEIITTYVSAQITSPLVNKSQVTYRDLTPICNLAMDEYTIGVLADSPYKTLEDFIKAAKEKPETITIGGSGKGTEDELVTGLLGKYAGVKFQYVSFNSSSEVMSAMLGGHLVAGIYNPNECESQYEAGQIRILGAFGPQRISMLPDIPTCVEAGYPEVIFQQFRGIFAAPQISEDAVRFWADIFKKVAETERWQTEYVKKNGLTSKYIAGKEFSDFLDNEATKYQEILRDIGAID